MSSNNLIPVGLWNANTMAPAFSPQDLASVIPVIREPLHIVQDRPTGYMGIALAGEVLPLHEENNSSYLLMSTLPAIYPEWLGDRSFQETHYVRYPYIAGAMFRGITSSVMVVEITILILPFLLQLN